MAFRGAVSHESGSTRRADLRARVLGAGLGLIVAVNLLPRLFRFCGDALIHLSVAERLLQGQPYAFNHGELASASSSLGWTLLQAGLLWLGGFELVGWGLPVLCLAALLACALLVRALSLALGARPITAGLSALIFLALPGVLYNGVLGMENGLFAAVVLGFCHSAIGSRGLRSALVAGALLGAAMLLRPEGVALLAPLALALSWPARFGLSRGWVLAVAALGLSCAVPVWLHHYLSTGLWVPGSGLSRLMLARRSLLSFHVAGPLWVYLDTLARFAFYLPLALPALFGARRLLGPEVDTPLRRARLVLPILGAGLLAYTFVIGPAHVARLTIWLFALLLPLAAYGWQPLLDRSRAVNHLRRLPSVLVALLVLGLAGETAARYRVPSQVHGGVTSARIVEAVRTRATRSDALLREICRGGCCAPGRVPHVALVEVQLRHALDHRIAVASLDGRTSALRDGRLVLRFDERACPVLDALLDAPHIVALLDRPLRAFPGCGEDQPLARALTAAWRGTAEVPGWRWSAQLRGFVRRCAR